MIVSIIILPSNPNILFISDYQRGVYVSTCGGQAWNAINDGLTYKAVSSLSLSGNEAALYASTTGGGVYRLDFGDGNTNREVVEPSASAQLEAIPVPSSATSVPSNATSVLPSPPPALPNVNDVIPSVTQIPQAVMPVTLYQSDFNITADGWDLSDGCMLQSDRNELSMPGNQMAVYEPSHEWTDYLLSFGFTLKGTMRSSFRIDSKTDSCYVLRLQENEFFIRKQINGEMSATLSDGTIIGLKNTWHRMLIEAVHNSIQIWLDDILLVDYTDVENPLLAGGFYFESLDNTQILLDNFLVQGPATE
jgi:hypothetical protein